jgi:hypothetical protein
MLRVVIAIVLGAHGIGHIIGVAGGWAGSAWGGSSDSWVLTPVLGRSTGIVEGLLWLLPTVGFLAAAGLLMAGADLWRPVALASAVVSLVAIALFPQQLTLGSLIGAIAVNVVVLVGLLVGWPSADAVGA